MPHLFKLTATVLMMAAIGGCASTTDMPPKSVETATTETMTGQTETTNSEAVSSEDTRQNIFEATSAAPNLTTFVALINQAQLAETLSGPGSFTVFAPSDTAFSTLAAETRESLMMDANRSTLQNILKNHILPSRLTADDLLFNIERNGGSFKTSTIEGVELRFFSSGDKVKMSDGRGYVSTVTMADLDQSNGIIHVISSVLMPE